MDHVMQTNMEEKSKPLMTSPSRSTLHKRGTKELTDDLIVHIKDYITHGKGEQSIQTQLRYIKRHRLRRSKGSGTFLQAGGLESLLSLVQHDVTSSSSSLYALVWSAIADLCALDEGPQAKVIQVALRDIGHVLSRCTTVLVISSTTRLLGNVISHPLFPSNQCPPLVQALTRLTSLIVDPTCLQNIFRTLRKMIEGYNLVQEFTKNNTLSVVIKSLKLRNSDVSLAGLSVIESCCINGPIELVSVIWSSENHEYLLLILEHAKVPPLSEATFLKAILIICYCSRHSDSRAALSRAGGMEILINLLSSSASYSIKDNQTFAVIDALCQCCKDVHGRQKIRDCNGLSLLINMLQVPLYSSVHDNILSALICYYFDEQTLRYMVRKLGLMKSLLYHLNIMIVLCEEEQLSDQKREERKREEEGEKEEEGSLMDPSQSITVNTSSSNSSNLSVKGSDASDVNIEEEGSEYDDNGSSVDHTSLQGSSIDSNFDAGSSFDQGPNNTIVSTDDTLYSSLSSASSVDHAPHPLSPISLEVLSGDTFLSPPPTHFNEFKNPTLIVTPPSQPTPVNFIDSVMSSPHYTSPPLPPPSPSLSLIQGQKDDTNKVLFLISRVSLLQDCQPILASPDILGVILKYFLSPMTEAVVSFDGERCFKILGRLFSNPICFQDCLVTLAPSLIFHHMASSSLTSSLTSSSLTSSSFTSSLTSSSPSITHPVDIYRRGQCVQLLNKLISVAESPYGQGVIAHMLLRGNSRDVAAGTLSLILLENSYSVCHKMLLHYRGLHNLFLLSQAEPIITYTCNNNTTVHQSPSPSPPPMEEYPVIEEQVQSMAIETLLYLASRYFKCPSRKRRFSQTERNGECTLFPTSKKIRLSSPSPSHSLPPPSSSIPPPTSSLASTSSPSLPPPTSSPSLSPPTSSCYYRDHDHRPFDTSILLDDGSIYQIHSEILKEASDVFSVMLSGRYLESNSTQVKLREISALSFESLIHHAYGCGFDCSNRRVAMTTSNEDRDELIEEIVSVIEKEELRMSARHCLNVLVCGNQYYLPSLLISCQWAFADRYLTELNIVGVYLFSQIHQCRYLTETCVNAILNLGPSERQTEIFKRLVGSLEYEKFIETIGDIFIDRTSL